MAHPTQMNYVHPLSMQFAGAVGPGGARERRGDR
jgi:hypothetical protein